MMNDDKRNEPVEEILARLMPRGVRPELRAVALSAVAGVLQGDTEKVKPASPWTRCLPLAVAASLFVAVGLNIALSKAEDLRLARLYGPRPISRQAMEIAEDIGKVAGPEMTQWACRQMTPNPRVLDEREFYASYAAYYKLLKQFSDKSFIGIDSKEWNNESPQKNHEMDRDRSGRAGCNPFDCQCLFLMELRQTA